MPRNALVELSEVDENKVQKLLRYVESVPSGTPPTPGPDDPPLPAYAPLPKGGGRPWLLEDEVCQIVEEYRRGSRIADIASKHDRCHTTILNQLRKAGVNPTQSNDRVVVTSIRRPQKYLDPHEIDELVAEYQSGSTVYELAAKFGCHRQTVSRHIKDRNVRMRLTALRGDQIDEAVRLYQSGLSLVETGNRIGASKNTVRQRLVERGVQIRDSHGRAGRNKP